MKIFHRRCRVEYSFFFFFASSSYSSRFTWAEEARNVYINMCCVKLNGKVYSLLDFITQKRALKNGKRKENLHSKVVYASRRV
jgi:hypothetical protein